MEQPGRNPSATRVIEYCDEIKTLSDEELRARHDEFCRELVSGELPKEDWAMAVVLRAAIKIELSRKERCRPEGLTAE